MGGPVVTSPDETLKTVRRRCCDWLVLASSGGGFCDAEEEGGGGGAGTEKRARSWDSVSRMSDVMSWFDNRAFVKIFGGGKLSTG